MLSPGLVLGKALRAFGHRFMAPELFDSWENDSVPTKTLASDCYALGQVIVEVRSIKFLFVCVANLS